MPWLVRGTYVPNLWFWFTAYQRDSEVSPHPDVRADKWKIDKLMGDVDQISIIAGEQPIQGLRPAVLISFDRS